MDHFKYEWILVPAKRLLSTLPPFDRMHWTLLFLSISLLMMLRSRHVTHLAVIRAEQARIARSLHDGFLQSVYGLVLNFQFALSDLPDHSPTRLQLERVLELADRVMQEGRDELQDLRAADMDYDLGNALTCVGEVMFNARQTIFHLQSQIGAPGKVLDRDVRRTAYFIGREAICNAFRHADASRISVMINYSNDRFIMQVTDDGKGIPLAHMVADRQGACQWGLSGIVERAKLAGGCLVIDSDTSGSQITFDVPASQAYMQTRLLQRCINWF